MAVMSATAGFGHLITGFDNRQLTELVATLLDTPYTARQATYDLRRLRRKGLIERFPHSNRYQLTPLGRRVTVLFTKTYGRVLAPGLVQLDPGLPVCRRPSPPAVHSLARGGTSTMPSTTTSATSSRQRDDLICS